MLRGAGSSPVARPGLEPGTPRFSEFPVAGDVQPVHVHRRQAAHPWRATIARPARAPVRNATSSAGITATPRYESHRPGELDGTRRDRRGVPGRCVAAGRLRQRAAVRRAGDRVALAARSGWSAPAWRTACPSERWSWGRRRSLSTLGSGWSARAAAARRRPLIHTPRPPSGAPPRGGTSFAGAHPPVPGSSIAAPTDNRMRSSAQRCQVHVGVVAHGSGGAARGS